MKWRHHMFTAFIVLLVYLTAGCALLNRYQQTGRLAVKGLGKNVEILRDEKGMAYIRASNTDDAIWAQGFVSAQDRMFQMDLTRRFASGRISEFAGEDTRMLDMRMRTIGFYRNAFKHAKLLEPATRNFFQKYADGVNAYLETSGNSLPLEYKLAGFAPELWTIEDSLAILYVMAWDSAANIQTEIALQMVTEKLGPEKARDLFPVNVNPDDSGPFVTLKQAPSVITGLGKDPLLMAYLNIPTPLGLGSNNWAISPEKSENGKPVLANDPHMDARFLPGPFYPVGLITPTFRVVGAIAAGIPGIGLGRNEFVAFGGTNAYCDMQDLYIETVDPDNPDNYLEGEVSIPFTKIIEKLKIKDKEAPDGYRIETLTIRMTQRGPLISGLLKGLNTDKVITLRFAPFETMQGRIGLDKTFTVHSVFDSMQLLQEVTYIGINYVFADTKGNIAWYASGKVPIRNNGDGSIPFVVKDSTDNWTGWIPFKEMPHNINPSKGWIGTCNQKTVRSDYPYYYSSYFSPSFRYRRLTERMNQSGKLDLSDHMSIQRDTKNLLAAQVAPIMASVLKSDPTTQKMGEILSAWNFHDDPEKAAPTIFQTLFLKFAFAVFEDELGPETADVYLRNWYIWQERLLKMILKGESLWFDDIRTTDIKETRDMLFHRAALSAAQTLKEKIGGKPETWQWGKVHRMEFLHPLRRSGFGKRLLGGGSYPAPGSGETLYRGWYDVEAPYNVTHCAAMRMVADLSDDQKVMAIMAGGVTGRVFHPHYKDQIKPYMNEELRYWWFSDEAIEKHCTHKMLLIPSSN